MVNPEVIFEKVMDWANNRLRVYVDGISGALSLLVGGNAVSATNPLPVGDNWRASLVSSETSNDSDVTMTVPASTEYQLLTIWVELVTTATVGDRQIEIQFTDASDDVIAQVQAGIVQAASLTRNYLFALNVADLTAFRDTSFLTTPLPCMVLPAGYKIRVYDNNAVDAAADDMVIQMVVNSRTV